MPETALYGGARTGRTLVFLALLCMGPAVVHADASAGKDENERQAAIARGRIIYLTGTSPSNDPITAVFGVEEIELPGTASTCGSCHGYDGQGYTESGIDPTNITWPYLTKSYGHVHRGGVHHPAYTRESLAMYIREGVFPGGERGDRAMPRFRISDADINDLLVYLEHLGSEPSPGISADEITIGTILPTDGPLAAAGETIEAVLRASFEAVNAQGGIYRRRLRLTVTKTAITDRTAVDDATTELATADVLALAATLTPGHDRAVAELVSRLDIPLIGPFNLYSATSYEARRQVFYLQPGLSDQLASLVTFAGAALELSTRKLVILHSEQPDSESLVAALTERARASELEPRTVSYRSGELDAQAVVSSLLASQTEILLAVVAEPQLKELLEETARQARHPYVLAAGVLSGNALHTAPEAVRDRLYLAYPTLPQDRKPAAARTLAALMSDGRVEAIHLQPAITAYAAAAVISEAVRRSGRDLNRRRLVEQLETLYRFETGLTPPITFAATQHTGAQGAYILGGTVSDGRSTPVAVWVESK